MQTKFHVELVLLELTIVVSCKDFEETCPKSSPKCLRRLHLLSMTVQTQVANAEKEKLLNCGWEVLSHPSSCLDPITTDSDLFPELKKPMRKGSF